jgi:AcrR family transcriptional regulator
MARVGYERASIAAIAEEADLGFGTFYSHFESKQAIFQALVELAVEHRNQLVRQVTARATDPAERFAIALAVPVELAARESELTRCLLEARRSADNPRADEALVARLREVVAAGCAAGRFHVPDQRAALIAAVGSLRALCKAVAHGELLGPVAMQSSAELGLRILGIEGGEAAQLANKAAEAARSLSVSD